MTVAGCLRILRERWLVVLLATVLGAVAGGGAFLLLPPTYTAHATLYVSARAAVDTQQAYQGAQLSEQRVRSYTALVTGRRVTSDVVAELGLPERPEDLADRITATSAEDSVLIDVAVRDGDPGRAAQIANRIGEAMTGIVAEMETPPGSGAPAPVALRVVEPAVAPDRPSSPGLLLLLTVGTTVGLALGCGGVLARRLLDVSVRSTERLEEVSGVPTLVSVPTDTALRGSRLVAPGAVTGPFVEAFRRLRTTLSFIDVTRPRRVVLVTSGGSGEGKTTTVVNLAATLATAGRRVLVVDADLRRPAVAESLGVEPTVGLADVLLGRVSFERALQHAGSAGVSVLAAGCPVPDPGELLASDGMTALLASARSRFDVVLVDTAPLLLFTDASALAPAADGVLLVCRYRTATYPRVAESLHALATVSVRPLGTILTATPPSHDAEYAGYRREQRSVPGVVERTTPAGPVQPARVESEPRVRT
ncbi:MULTISPECIES: polysaccharide biosynthesis tyrosine autokinase [Pseudonocardia]|uniref:polysaccharide biosynthesis tyrosine autokinase n=1 Tax=Pseudonocardia TaxID=1847 RepID=UPI001AD746F1|nr:MULTISPECIES: polysaccharide biosynthesis tyrosine autokinase [Pseudonocardia]MBO4237347.1 polysaccharide biosynthesis tyrosine autokinase [Pseudonocardia alni]